MVEGRSLDEAAVALKRAHYAEETTGRFRKGGKVENCIFCRIVAGEVPSEILYQDDEVIAFRDINPQAPVHLLVVSRKHITSALQAEARDGKLLASVFEAVASLAEREDIASSGVRVVTNAGRAAGQEVPHLHFHVLGGRMMSWPPG